MSNRTAARVAPGICLRVPAVEELADDAERPPRRLPGQSSSPRLLAQAV